MEFYKRIYVGDFETVNLEDDAKVCAWKLINNEYREWYGVDIESFIECVMNLPLENRDTDYIRFHNGSGFDFWNILFALGKDTRFRQRKFVNSKKIIDISNLVFSQYKAENTVKKREKPCWGDYDVIITGNKKINQLTIWRGEKKSIVFQCSYLIFSKSLKKLGQVLMKKNPEMSLIKGDRDHKKNRFYDTKEELKADKDMWIYLSQDVKILMEFMKAVNQDFGIHKLKMTSALTAYEYWSASITTPSFKKLYKKHFDPTEIFQSKLVGLKKRKNKMKKTIFRGKLCSNKQLNTRLMSFILPTNWLDKESVRDWYLGGLTYINPLFLGVYKTGLTYLDINSSYPSVMNSFRVFPFGKPSNKKLKGYDFIYFRIDIKRVENKYGLPFIPTPNEKGYKDCLRVLENVSIHLSSIELPNFQKFYVGEYQIFPIKYFRCVSGKELFAPYVNYWYKIRKDKKTSAVLREGAKLFLNSLYGKLASKTDRTSFIYNDQEFKLEREMSLLKQKFYMPIGCAITAYARMKLVDAVDFQGKHLLYTDTDSITVSKEFVLSKLNISDNLGDWKVEHKNANGVFVRKKGYWLETKEAIKKCISGFDFKEEDIKMEDMLLGFTLDATRSAKKVSGVLIENIEKMNRALWDKKTHTHPENVYNEEFWKKQINLIKTRKKPNF